MNHQDLAKYWLIRDDDELDSLKKLINKKKDKYPDQQKLMSFLASKGFSYSSIKEALSVEDDLNF